MRLMPTDDQVDRLFTKAAKRDGDEDGAPEEDGSGIDWDEFHMPTEYRQ